MYYKAILYDNGKVEVKLYSELHIEVEEISDEEAFGWSDSCYSFYEATGFGRYAIRETREEAIKALLDSYITTLDAIEEEYVKCKEKIDVLKSALPKKSKCWECKHWGSVDCWGNYIFDGHWHAVRKPKSPRVACPCQMTKNGKYCRSMSADTDACDKFVKYSDVVNG